MFFSITNNNGVIRYVRTSNNAQADEVAARLKTIKLQGHIKNFERLDFAYVKPKDILKD
jgi:hypothetical protein